MNFNLQEFGVTLVLGAYCVLGLGIVFRNKIHWNFLEWSRLGSKGHSIQTVFYLALFFALGMIAENASNYWVDAKWWGFPTETEMRQSVLFKEREGQDKFFVPTALLRNLAEQQKISKFLPHIGRELESHVKNNKDFSNFRENLGFFSNELYYVAKNIVYPKANIFQEMRAIQIRIDFIRSMAFLSALFSLLILLKIIYRGFCYCYLAVNYLWFDKYDDWYAWNHLKSLLMPFLVFGFFYFFGIYVFAFEEKEFNKRAFGYFASLDCSENICGPVAPNNGGAGASSKHFETIFDTQSIENVKKLDISGLAKIHGRGSAFLVVHDVKDKFKNIDKARVGIITTNDGEREYHPICFEKWEIGSIGISKKENNVLCESDTNSAQGGLKAWKRGDRPSDFEAVCAIPNKGKAGRDKVEEGEAKAPSEFLIAESGYYKGEYGRIFHIDLKKENGNWQAQIKSILLLPSEIEDIEGLACVRESADKIRIFLGKRREEDHGTIIQKFIKDEGGQLNWHGSSEKEYLFYSAVNSRDKSWRYISDLYMDSEERLWISSAQDYGWDDGPFKSIIYKVRGLEKDDETGENVLKLEIKKQWNLDKVKVEALGSGLENTILTLGTDNENKGGGLISLKEE